MSRWAVKNTQKWKKGIDKTIQIRAAATNHFGLLAKRSAKNTMRNPMSCGFIINSV